MAKRKHARERAPRKRVTQKRKRVSHKKKRVPRKRKRKTQKGGLISHRSNSGGPLLWFAKQMAKYGPGK